MRHPPDRTERGAVAIFIALAMTLLLVAAALAVDLGMQRVLKRDLQAMADVVALDMTRQLDGRTHAQIKAANVWRTQLEASVARNLGVHPDAVTAKQQQEDAVATVVGNDMVVTATMGYLKQGEFEKLPYPEVPTAVEVTARSVTDFTFARVIGIEEGGAHASAVGTSSTPTVCLSVGTRTLTLNTDESGLSPLLNHILSVKLGAVEYGGIVDLKNVSVPLAALMAQLNVGSVSQLASTSIGIGPFMAVVADVLRADKQTVAADILEAVELAVPSTSIALAKILSLGTATNIAGLTAKVNIFDLLTAAVLAANGQNGINLGIADLASLKIIEPPQIACGGPGTVARSAQIQLLVNPGIGSDNNHKLLGGDVYLPVEVGRASATIGTPLACGPDSVPLTVTTGAARVLLPSEALPPVPGDDHQVTLRVGISVIADLLLWPLSAAVKALVDDVSLDVAVGATIAGSSSNRTVTYPVEGLPPTVVFPLHGIGSLLDLDLVDVELSSGQGALLELLSPVLNGVLDVLPGIVRPVVNGVVDPLLAGILNPVLSLLGIKLGVAEVDMLSRPDCNTVRLTR